MLRIGLTGGIGCGKSLAAELFAAHGAAIIDADIAARAVVEPGSPALEEIAETFGAQLLNTDGSLDRGALRARIFGNDDERRQLEAILHPRIRQWMLEQAQGLSGPYLIFVVPLLLESGWQSLVDRILVVDCTPRQQLERAMDRDRAERAQIEAIIASQCTRQQRLQAADDICRNDGEPEQLKSEVARLHQLYLQMAAAL